MAFQTHWERKVAYRELVEEPKEKDHLVDSGKDRKILKKKKIIKLIF